VERREEEEVEEEEEEEAEGTEVSARVPNIFWTGDTLLALLVLKYLLY
jgi:hypothetical protein